MPKYKQATDEMVELVEKCIEDWHPWLENARFAVLMLPEAPRPNGRIALAGTKKASDEVRALGADYHFIMWFAHDQWEILTPEQRVALVDHELSHCRLRGGAVPALVQHDFSEFNAVFLRHGPWWPGAESTVEAMQPHFAFYRGGTVDAVDPASFDEDANDEDVIDQVDDMLNGRVDVHQGAVEETNAEAIEQGEEA